MHGKSSHLIYKYEIKRNQNHVQFKMSHFKMFTVKGLSDDLK